MIPKYLNRREPRIPFTKEGYDKVLKEKEELLAQRPDAVDHLRKARAMGDLKENGYYQASRQRLSFLDSRIRRAERLIKLGVIVEAHGNSTVEIGSHVSITDGSSEYSYTIVGGYESDPKAKTISNMSPLGRALFGKKLNDTVTVHAPAGDKSYTIVSIST
jgi:transcription elongation factor GreA